MTNFINLATVFTTALALTASSVSSTVYVDKSIDTTDEIVVEYDYGIVEDTDDEDEIILSDVNYDNIEYDADSTIDVAYGYVSFEEDFVNEPEEIYYEDIDNDNEEWYDDYEDEDNYDDWYDDWYDDTSNEELTTLDYALEHLDEFEHWEVINDNDEIELHIIIDNEEYCVVYSYQASQDEIKIDDTIGYVPPTTDTDNNEYVVGEYVTVTVDKFIENTY